MLFSPVGVNGNLSLLDFFPRGLNQFGVAVSGELLTNAPNHLAPPIPLDFADLSQPHGGDGGPVATPTQAKSSEEGVSSEEGRLVAGPALLLLGGSQPSG